MYWSEPVQLATLRERRRRRGILATRRRRRCYLRARHRLPAKDVCRATSRCTTRSVNNGPSIVYVTMNISRHANYRPERRDMLGRWRCDKPKEVQKSPPVGGRLLGCRRCFDAWHASIPSSKSTNQIWSLPAPVAAERFTSHRFLLGISTCHRGKGGSGEHRRPARRRRERSVVTGYGAAACREGPR